MLCLSMAATKKTPVKKRTSPKYSAGGKAAAEAVRKRLGEEGYSKRNSAAARARWDKVSKRKRVLLMKDIRKGKKK